VAMNRSLTNVLFGGIGTTVSQENRKMEGAITQTTVEDTVDALTNADSVILVIHILFLRIFSLNGVTLIR
jgi:H+-translocating NAD(P) transhydrogenase